MPRANGAGVTHARSVDGTQIAYWTSGEGPPLVLVHGTPADHTRWEPLLPFLEPHRTVHALDRRGRGGSGDTLPYTIEREFEDVAVVVDTVADSAGTSVEVYGHSHGGIVAFGAAARTANARKLALYEGWPVPNPEVFALPTGLAERMDALLAAGDRAGVVEALFREIEQMSDDDLVALKEAPSWPGRVAAADTITREVRGEQTVRLDDHLAKAITVPVLLLVGEKSSDPAKQHVDAVATALSDARVTAIPNEEHVADILAPEHFANMLMAFLNNDA